MRDDRVAPRHPGCPPPPSGICRFCGITEKNVDGDKRSWYGKDRTCCSQSSCVRQHHEEIASVRQKIAIEQQRRESARRQRADARNRGHLKGGAA
jgi:hypothetical protein